MRLCWKRQTVASAELRRLVSLVDLGSRDRGSIRRELAVVLT